MRQKLKAISTLIACWPQPLVLFYVIQATSSPQRVAMATKRPIALSQEALTEELLSVAREGMEFAGSTCPRILSPSPTEFLRDYVLPNRPCIITDALQGWKALSLWTDDYLTSKLGEALISVNVTPNGRGDAVLDDKYFVMPEERRMTFAEFLSKLRAPKSKVASGGVQCEEQEVYYLSHQDDNLRTQVSQAAQTPLVRTVACGEQRQAYRAALCASPTPFLLPPRTQLAALLPDVAPTLAFAESALGCAPDAVNMWMGPAAAVTTLHMDHYENLYAVVRGEKVPRRPPPPPRPA